jgi:AraC-like DNA-binding protein
MKATQPETTFIPATIRRPAGGPRWVPDEPLDLPLSGLYAWQSNGGVNRGHPARSLPFSLEAPVPQGEGSLVRIHLVGLFALHAEKAGEAPGTLGATVHLLGERDVTFRQDLINGRHYFDARKCDPVDRQLGDGTSLQSLGACHWDGCSRVDKLSIEVPPKTNARSLVFKDLGSPASFVIFDILFEFQRERACPFSARSGGVPLAELASIVRVGDRVRFGKAVQQLEQAISQCQDLDEGRGEALTFLAVLTAATLELGGSRTMHRVQLEAAREMDRADTREEVLEVASRRIDELAESVFPQCEGPSSHLIDRALAIVERNYAKDLSDAAVSAQLGLSTSHFRFLFRQATGQPFHKYLIAVRLEKAKRMLLDMDLPVSQIAQAVGFTGLSHFSRAFTHRFSVSPTAIRRSAS